MRTKHLLIILGFLVLALVCNDIEDTLVHHYDTSIFAPLGHDSYFYPDWTRLYKIEWAHTYYEQDSSDCSEGFIIHTAHRIYTEKTFIGEWLPFLLDGWHLFKVIRWLAIGTAIIILLGLVSIQIRGDYIPKYFPLPFWQFYIGGITVWLVLVWGLHKLVYGWLLIK